MDDEDVIQVIWFDSDHPEFGRGFEAGKIWGQMRDQKPEFMETVSVWNTEMVMRLAEAGNYRFVAEPLNDYYHVVAFQRKEQHA